VTVVLPLLAAIRCEIMGGSFAKSDCFLSVSALNTPFHHKIFDPFRLTVLLY
jgi:hypothetical protein